MIPATEFLSCYPDFNVVPLNVIQYELDGAEACYFQGVWRRFPERYRRGVMLVAAHELTMRWQQTSEIAAAAASIASGQGGGNPTQSDNDFSLSHYGRQYLELAKTIPAHGLNF